MADEQINILITAIDDVSKKVDSINKNISTMSEESTKQTKSLSNAFTESTGTLLALGSAASRVDSIFDSYDNMQLRLENSTTRVYEAQKNVRDAQYQLNKVMKDGQSTAEDVAKAQDDLETANNRVTMAQNNLQRANNATTGTYIQMGMSVVTLIASIPKLAESISALTLSMTGLKVAAGPIGWAILAIGAAVTGYTMIVNHNKKEQEELIASTNDYNESVRTLETSHARLAIGITETNEAMKTTQELMYAMEAGKSEEELKNMAELTKKREELLALQQGNKNKIWGKQTKVYDDGTVVTTNIKKNTKALEDEILQLEEKQKQFQLRRATLAAETDLVIYNKHKELQDDTAKLNEKTNEAYKVGLNDLSNFVKTTFGDEFQKTMKEQNDKLIAADKKVTDDFMARWGAVYNMKKKALSISGSSSGGSMTTRTDMGTKFPKFNDFMMRPGQEAISFSPNDTIIGMKDPSRIGGKTIVININGNNYGTDPTDIANALNQRLSNMVRTW